MHLAMYLSSLYIGQITESMAESNKILYMLLHPSEMHIQFMQMFQKNTQ